MVNGTIPFGAVGLDVYTLIQQTPGAQIHFLTGLVEGAQLGCVIIVDSEIARESTSFVLQHDPGNSTGTALVFKSTDGTINLTLTPGSGAQIDTTTDLNFGNVGNRVPLKQYALSPDTESTGYSLSDIFHLDTTINDKPVHMQSDIKEITNR